MDHVLRGLAFAVQVRAKQSKKYFAIKLCVWNVILNFFIRETKELNTIDILQELWAVVPHLALKTSPS